MANQVEAPKVVGYTALGPDSDEASATKVVLYMLLEPGSVDAGPQGQGHVHTQIIVRAA